MKVARTLSMALAQAAVLVAALAVSDARCWAADGAHPELDAAAALTTDGAGVMAPAGRPVLVDPPRRPVGAESADSSRSIADGGNTRVTAAPARPGVDVRRPEIRITPNDTSFAIRAVIGLTVLALLPAMLMCLTAFLRIIVVLSMLRHAIGMPETPPNTALIGLALFLTMFTMAPVLQTVNTDSLQPFMQGRIGMEQAYTKASGPMREFMIRQTREQDLALMVELSKAAKPESMDDVSNVQLIPAFMLSELRAAFQIGFVIFLPFLLIDLIVSSVLMALGMMMMPPMTIALPLKILMFILIDGWSVLLKALVGSFH